jgi:hypothetical protein
VALLCCATVWKIPRFTLPRAARAGIMRWMHTNSPRNGGRDEHVPGSRDAGELRAAALRPLPAGNLNEPAPPQRP